MAVGLNPIEGSEIMELLSVPTYDLEDPHRFLRIKEVVEYFQDKPDRRHQILKIIFNRPGDDKLDVVWTWVQLRIEMEKRIHQLDPKEFTEDVQKDIEEEYLTSKNLSIIKKQVNERLGEERKIVSERKASRKENAEIEKTEVEAVGNVSSLSNLKTKLEEIESIKSELEAYG